MIDRRNQHATRTNQPERWQDPVVMAVEITQTVQAALADLDYPTIRATGFRTQRDFYDDWMARHHTIDPDRQVWVCWFTVIEDAWYLHHATDGGLTRDPSKAMKGEGQAVSPTELKLLGARAERKHETEKRATREAMPLEKRLAIVRQRAADGDSQAARHLHVIKQRIEAAERQRGRDVA